jgi:ribosomal protein S30
MTKRREFSKPVKAEIMKRCEVPTGFQCEECGAIVPTGEIDHTIAEELVIDKSKKLTAADGKFLCWPCHQGPDGKTPKDKAIIAKAKRQEAGHLRIQTPKQPIKSAGFAPPAEKQRSDRSGRIDKGAMAPLPRRNPLTREIIG